MAKYTNMSQRLITTSDSVQMPPGIAVEISDEAASNQAFKDMIEAKEIIAGEPPKQEETTQQQPQPTQPQPTQPQLTPRPMPPPPQTKA